MKGHSFRRGIRRATSLKEGGKAADTEYLRLIYG